jgi:predicted nucleotidyltransferase
MPPVSRLGRQIAEVAAALNAIGARFALIGGLALASYKVVRATQDVDLLTEVEKADEIDAVLARLGYRCLHRGAEAGNYARGDERVDFLYASRPIACRLLAEAEELKTALGDLRVVSAEGLIGFKLQGFVNDPRRTQDLEDIRALLRANSAMLDMAQVREYFRLFERESLLDELIRETT